jgi:hypothetical protein
MLGLAQRNQRNIPLKARAQGAYLPSRMQLVEASKADMEQTLLFNIVLQCALIIDLKQSYLAGRGKTLLSNEAVLPGAVMGIANV